MSEFKPILILAAMKAEYDAVLKFMDVSRQDNLFEGQYSIGTILGRDVILALSGVGKIFSALTTQYFIHHFNPGFIVFTGVGGAINETYSIGDIVIAKDCVQHDMDGRGLGFVRGQIPYSKFCFFNADSNLVSIAKSCPSQHTIHLGRVLTGDQFITHRDMVHYGYLRTDLMGDVVDMEGASVAFVCQLYHKPFLLVRTISDKADQDASVDFERFLPTIAENSVAVIQYIIRNSPY